MRKFLVSSAILAGALLGASPFALAQRPGLEIPLVTPGPGWKTCPRCENDAHVQDDRKKANVDTHPFDAHDLSGVWGDNGIPIDFKARPPFTPEGQKLYDALAAQVGQANMHDAAEKDPLMICDPLGTVRAFGYNYGIEFVTTPGRVFEFYEWSHTWRTIFTDGRKLPDDPPVDRYLGYNVGHWDGDTFVVESYGYDPRSLIGADSTKPVFPHSEDMRIVQTYKRLDYGKLQATMTITDPKVYTAPWVTTGVALLHPNAEIGEYFCVPSESIAFNEKQTEPSRGGTSK
jgi:hypothetical protein